jgi:hypothetical protein
MFCNIKTGIKNLITWAPIIWRDKQWDHYFLFEIMNKKLSLMEKFFDSDDVVILDAKKTAKQIRVARILIERLKKDEYDESFHDKLDKKWGRPDFFFKPIENGKYSTLERTIDGVKTEKDEKKYTKELKRIYAHVEMQRKQDKEYFCKIFKKYVDHWWE